MRCSTCPTTPFKTPPTSTPFLRQEFLRFLFRHTDSQNTILLPGNRLQEHILLSLTVGMRCSKNSLYLLKALQYKVEGLLSFILSTNKTNRNIILGPLKIRRQLAGIGDHDRQHPSRPGIIYCFIAPLHPRWSGNTLSRRPYMQQLAGNRTIMPLWRFLTLLFQRRNRSDNYLHNIPSSPKS